MVMVRWMWGDAAVFSSRAAKMNPLRWSRTRTIEQAIDDLQRHAAPGFLRPVRFKLTNVDGVDLDEQTGHESGNSPRSVRTEWSQQTSAGVLRSRVFPSIELAVYELQRLQSPASELKDIPEAIAAETSKATEVGTGTSGFRFEDLDAIPKDLLDGPFEDFEISNDVYTTAYLIARNATPDMYSFSPIKNPQVRIVWKYLCFIIATQLFIIGVLTFLCPPTVTAETYTVDCSNRTSLEMLASIGALSEPTSEACREAGDFAFEADVRRKTVSYYKLEHTVPFYDAILLEGSATIYVLRFICCAWQFGQVYFEDFDSIRRLFDYHDFSQWFLPVKGEDLRPSYALVIPMIQFCVLLIVTSVSFAVLCAQTEAFDIVMNSLAFTFIAQVGGFFNGPLAQHLGETIIHPAPNENYPVAYMYPEYTLANAVNEDGSYTDGGWYICEDEVGKAGLLSDYKIRHNPAKYDHHCKKLVSILEWVLVVVPVCVVFAGAVRSGAHMVFVEAAASWFTGLYDMFFAYCPSLWGPLANTTAEL